MKELIKDTKEFMDKIKTKKWCGTLEQYLLDFFSDQEKLLDPEDKESKSFKLCQRSAHAYVRDMLLDSGIRYNEKGEVSSFDLIDKSLFGIETLQKKLYEFLNSASLNKETRRRMLLIYGPPGSGKTELVNILKRGLEAYNKTSKGAVYAIKGCPIHEDPLNTIPYALRDKFKEKGINIDGSLCPTCTKKMEEILEKDDSDIFKDIEVEQVFFNETLGKGIETIRASEIKKVFSKTHDEELSLFKMGNRGIVELEDTVLKDAKESIDILLSLTQEKKLGRTHLDELLILTANEEDLLGLLEKKKSLLDRISIIKAPYNTKPSEEKKVYEKFLKEETDLGETHMAPHTLDLAALFGTITRFFKVSDKEKLDEIQKNPAYGAILPTALLAKVFSYDNDDIKPLEGIKKVLEKIEIKDEGMFGVSPRFVNDRIIAAIILSKTNNSCVSPIKVLKEIEKGLTKHKFSDEEIKQYKIFLWGEQDEGGNVNSEGVIHEYERMAKAAVQKAFYKDFDKELEILIEDYLKNAKAFLDNETLTATYAIEEEKPNEGLMRDVEEFIAVSEADKKTFRNRAYLGFLTYSKDESKQKKRPGEETLKAYLDLRKGAKFYLFDERSRYIKALISRNPSKEELEIRNEVLSNLRQNKVYCEECSIEVMQYATNLFKKEEEKMIQQKYPNFVVF